MEKHFDEIYLTQAEYYMQECFDLAKKGFGRTSPNPIVGAIVLDKDGNPVGRGFHKKAGDYHAEVIAINEAGGNALGGTLIINLEPCCHQGKTPPCADLIIKSGIKEVIFSCLDPNPLVSGKGKAALEKHNIKVISGILESEGKELNKFFLKWITTKMPWICLKQAQTLDGKIALSNGESRWISSELSRKEVHSLRNIYDAVLVGASTIQADDPELTVRLIDNGRNPIRVILDTDLKSSPKSRIFSCDGVDIILVTEVSCSKEKLNNFLNHNDHIKVIQFNKDLNGRINLIEVFQKLGELGILSVMVEAGPNLAGELLLNGLVDEYILFIAPKIFGDASAISSLKLQKLTDIQNSIEFKLFDYKPIGNDLMISLRR